MPTSIPHYLPPFFLRNGNLNTIFSFLYRADEDLPFERETIETSDGDFLEIDLLKSGQPRCAVLVHGLEGTSQSGYILSLARLLEGKGWDVAAVNLRGCSGVPNRLYRAYYSGATDDLGLVIEKMSADYPALSIVGFSLGGNIVLKYAGEKGNTIPKEIKAVVGISVPCDLSTSSDKLEKWTNELYEHRFLVSLKAKLKAKMQCFPEKLEASVFEGIRTVRQFDDVYTAPANGFKDAEDYYSKCSSLYSLHHVAVPTLIVNAQDDPFLSEKCFPWKEAEANPNICLLAPKYGGHVGFWPERGAKLPKHEEWILKFLAEHICG